MKKHFSRPLPRGKGFFVSGRRLMAAFVLAAGTLAAVPAHAANVTVTLDVYRGFPPAALTVAHCNVSVVGGASGVAVLQAADASGCITSYAVTNQYGFGTWLECINSDCEIPRNSQAHGLVTYWRQSVNGVSTCYGLDGFEAAQGKELGFSYTATGSIAVDIAVGCTG